MEALFWLLLVIVFIVFEMISLGLTTIWFAGGAFVAGIAALCGAPIWVQIILFLVVSIVLLITTRPIAQKHLNNKVEKTNVEGLVGTNAFVQETIDNQAGTGKIRINDVEWTARSSKDEVVIPVDSKVVIQKIAGVKCIVDIIHN